jgi:hypothetical protein
MRAPLARTATVSLLSLLSLSVGCNEPPPRAPPREVPAPQPARAEPRAPSTPPATVTPTPGTRTVLAHRANDDAWDKMLVAGGRLWVLTNVGRWTDGPMYVPAARLWSVPVSGGTLTQHMELEGMGALAADETWLYVSVNRDLSKSGTRTGRVLRLPLAGGAPVDLVTGIEPRLLAVDGDTLWIDETTMPKDGSKRPLPSSAKAPMTFAFDGDSVYFTTAKGAGPAGDRSGARVFRLPKKGGPPALLAATLPEEATGLAVDATHVYFCAVGWSSPALESAGIVARVPKDGGDVEILAKDQPSLRRAWIDDKNVYFLSGRAGHLASVLRVAKAGGEVSKVAADDTLEQATMDATAVYFSSDGTFDAASKARLSPANLVRVLVR